MLSHFFPIVLRHIPSFFPLFFSSCSPPLQSPQVHLGGRTRGESILHRHPIATWYITLKKFTCGHLFYHLISWFLILSGRSAPRPPKLTLFAKITSPSLAAGFRDWILFWGWNVHIWWPAHRKTWTIKPMELRRKLDTRTWHPLQNAKRHWIHWIHKHQKGNAATFICPIESSMFDPHFWTTPEFDAKHPPAASAYTFYGWGLPTTGLPHEGHKNEMVSLGIIHK